MSKYMYVLCHVPCFQAVLTLLQAAHVHLN